jgi:transcriptional regulator
MYVPAHFAVTDAAALHDFIERHSFAQLVTHLDGAPFVSHLPFLLDRAAGPNGTLVGHMARANPQWRHGAGRPALVVFSGPHAYVSPTWYEAEHVVPTWNYTAVHATGVLHPVEDRDAVLGIVRRTVETYEAAMPRPWSPDWSATFIDRLLGQIVGFRIPIDRLEGKWKLNQNHPPERREKVIRALEGRGGEESLAVAALMREVLQTG